jgi:xanthine/uracil permease
MSRTVAQPTSNSGTEEAARGFFSDELVEMVTGVYGVRPTVTFVEVAELIDNE